MNSTNINQINLDNNTSLSIGTEEQYSATSPDLNQSGGGLWSYLFGSNESSITELAMDAFNDNNPYVGCYNILHAIRKHHKLDFSKKDSHKRNLLHLLTAYCSQYPEAKKILLTLLSTPDYVSDLKAHINDQDDKLNTVAHIALINEMQDVVHLLKKIGLNLSLKNADGNKIEYEQSSVPVHDDVSQNKDIFVKMTNVKCDEDKQMSDFEKRIQDIVQMFVQKTESDNETIGFKHSTKNDSSVSADRRLPIFSPTSASSETNIGATDSGKIIQNILNEFRTQDQKGGKKNEMTGKRKLVTYSELSTGGASGSDSVDIDSDFRDSDLDNLSEMARAVENKATEAHKRAVDRIKEILGIDEAEARAYKAIIWELLKTSQKGMSNFDRSMELEKRASDKDFLNSIDQSEVTKMIQLISEKQKEKQSSSVSSSETVTEKKPKKKTSKKKTKSEESTETPSELGLETVISIDSEL